MNKVGRTLQNVNSFTVATKYLGWYKWPANSEHQTCLCPDKSIFGSLKWLLLWLHFDTQEESYPQSSIGSYWHNCHSSESHCYSGTYWGFSCSYKAPLDQKEKLAPDIPFSSRFIYFFKEENKSIFMIFQFFWYIRQPISESDLKAHDATT